jgi:cysteinyl-tRNA synthetase
MRFALIAAALAVGTVTGCKEEPKAGPATVPTTTQPSVADTLKANAEKAAEKAGEVKDQAVEKAGEIKDKASEKAGEIKDAIKSATQPSATTESTGVMAKVQEEAVKLYDKAMEAVKNKDFAAADKALEGLEKMKSQLSPDWQGKIDSLKATIETAKKAGAVKIPGVN